MRYYKNHIGRGTYFVGRRYQRGNGFFGSMLKNAIYPLLKYLGAKGIKTAVAIGKEAVENPHASLKTIAKQKFTEAGVEAMEDGLGRVKRLVQGGGGLKRKRRSSEGIRRVTKRRKIVRRKKQVGLGYKRNTKQTAAKRKQTRRRRRPSSFLTRNNGIASI